MADSFEIDVTLLSDTGRVRSHNQDSVSVCEPADHAALSHSGRLYIVADGAGGVGGARSGELASRYAVLKVEDLYYASGRSDAPAGERLRISMLATNDAIREHCRRPGRNIRMATTMVAAIVRGRELTIANVGDSRAYLMRDSVIQQITQDHSLVAGLLANGVITPEEAAGHPQRNVILHSLSNAPHDPRIDLFPLTLQLGDTVLLCTDGLTRYLGDQQLLALLTQEPRDQAAHRLIAAANASGGADNISVAVLRIKRTALPPWIWWLLFLSGIGLALISGLAGLLLILGE